MSETIPPARVGRFLLIEQRAISTTATVWRGRDTRRRRDVAIKRFHPHVASDPIARARIEGEAAAARKVHHRAILPLVTKVATRTELALVFPYVPGRTLAERLTIEPPLASTDAVHVATEIADALAAAHRLGILHRDVKPANILLADDGQPRLVDFGIARDGSAAGVTNAELTAAGTAIGTLAYMAPEQLHAAPTSAATDVYALGVVLYEMLAGSRPFSAASAVTLAQEQRLPPARIASAPGPVMDLTLAALSAEQGSRPTASAMAASLRSWTATGQSDAPTVVVPAAAAPASSRATSSRHLTILAAGAAAIPLVAAVGFLALAGSGPSADATLPALAFDAATPHPSATPAKTPPTATPPAPTDAPPVVAPAADRPPAAKSDPTPTSGNAKPASGGHKPRGHGKHHGHKKHHGHGSGHGRGG